MKEISTGILIVVIITSISAAQSEDSIKTGVPSIDIKQKGINYSEEYNQTENDTPFVAVEIMPEPIGGIKGIQEKIWYPKEAIKNKVEGTVYILAFVDEFGNVTKAEILKGIGGGCDEIALMAVKLTQFTPGIQEGKKVKVQVSIPIIFKLK